MEDISLHILDLVQNSISAEADTVEIYIKSELDILELKIKDNGKGMDKEAVGKALNPFFTTRTTRRVGLGLSFLKASAEATGGSVSISSQPYKGTTIKAVFNTSHIDCLPLGSVEDTMVTLILCNPVIRFIFIYKTDNSLFKLDTAEILKVLDGVNITDPDVISWIKEYIKEGLNE